MEEQVTHLLGISADCWILGLLLVFTVGSVRLKRRCLQRIGQVESTYSDHLQLRAVAHLTHLQQYLVPSCLGAIYVLSVKSGKDVPGGSVVLVFLATGALFGASSWCFFHLETLDQELDSRRNSWLQKQNHNRWRHIYLLPQPVPVAIALAARVVRKYADPSELYMTFKVREYSEVRHWLMDHMPEGSNALGRWNSGAGHGYHPKTQHLVLRLLIQDRWRRAVVHRCWRYIDPVSLLMLQDGSEDPSILPVIADRLEENGCSHRRLLAALRHRRLYAARLLLQGWHQHVADISSPSGERP